MIHWNEIESLHVILKLQQILGKWYDIDLVFTDTNGKIKSKQLEKDYTFNNLFFKVQMSFGHGPEIFKGDIGKVVDLAKTSDKNHFIFDTYFKNVKGIAVKVIVDGEYLGLVFGLPFMLDNSTAQDKEEVIKELVALGASSEEATRSVESFRIVPQQNLEYLQELVELVTDEIKEFHEEVMKREERIQELNSELGDKYRYHTMIGKSKRMQVIYRLLEKISNSETSVFVQGSNGTGKELVAKAIHYYSPRKENMFLAVNCSAFNDNLLDSELFGHVRGAFTGAIKDKKGLFESANGGTLFLDEIGDTSLNMQVKLLRVLQEGTFLPVGATTPRRTDIRIIAATNKNIQQMMKDGEFREDLYYRINVININLPSLEERKDDIPILVDHFMKKRCDEMGISIKQISNKTMEKILDYNWPGNVRELENEIERLVVLAGEDKIITPEHLSNRILDAVRGARGEASGEVNGIDTSGSLKKAQEELEIIMISEGLKRCNFNKSKLSKELGISRASLIMKVEKYELDKRKKAA